MSEELSLIGIMVASAIRAGTPVWYATTGEILSQRSGVINLGLEGAMLLGAVAACWTQLSTGSPGWAIAAAAGAGLLIGLLHGVVTVMLGANLLAAGICLFFVARGLSGVLGQPIVGKPVEGISPVPLPWLSDLPVLGEALFAQDVLVYLAAPVTLATWFLLFRTRVGLLLRATGENAEVARAEGVPVCLMRLSSLALGGALAGVGGAHVVLAFSRTWMEAVTAGRGWIAIGLVVLARWNPIYAAPAACLFGGVVALQLQAQVAGVALSPYLLSMLPYLFTILALVVARFWASGSGMPAELARLRY